MVLRTLSWFGTLRLRSPQPIPNPQDLSHLSCWSLGLTSDLYASLPSAAPPRGSAEGPAGAWTGWVSPCQHPRTAMAAPPAPLGAVAKAGWGPAGPLAGAWGCHLGSFVE